jgi:hypothetical protein
MNNNVVEAILKNSDFKEYFDSNIDDELSNSDCECDNLI